MRKKYTTFTETGVLFNVKKEFSMDENKKVYENAKYSLNWKNLLTILLIIFIICQTPNILSLLTKNIDLSSYVVNLAMIKNEEKREAIQERCTKMLLEKDELMQLSEQDLQCLINTIYAVHGQYFDEKTKIHSYFMEFEWYQNIPKKNVVYEELDAVQRENVDLLVSVMRTKGYRE